MTKTYLQLLDVENEAKTFGDWLHRWRKRCYLSMEALGQKVGMSKQYISVLEREVPHPLTNRPVTPSREKILALAKALGAEPNEALRLAGYASEETGETHRLGGVTIVFHEDCGIDPADRQNLISTVSLMVEGVKAKHLHRSRPGMSDIIPSDLELTEVADGGEIGLNKNKGGSTNEKTKRRQAS